ncbi:methionyl-tRNA formyltransferase [Caldicoprobacter guelmensis]|uniref:methionyl-tRNA formyltransferase n=1 Tax=Caldicoprobacter guelmensis TaxID=1170224 RepID=UPI00311C959A|nr:methionyl-tRNA formyltransferase [Caldicoprobacter guelmensis]
MLKIVFMGTPEFAIPSLEAIVSSGHKLIGVVTQPDKPKGRGKKLASPPVKEWATARNIPVYQPEKVRDPEFIKILRGLAPDLIVTAAYGQILPKEILDIPPLGCVNVHASLLPKYRGSSPIQQALMDGETETGITIMYMDVGMDTGDIILQKSIPIYPDEQAGELHDRLAVLGGQALAEALKMFENGRPEGRPQEHDKATYCKKIDKSMGNIDWTQSAIRIKNLVRGLTPWPGTFTFLDDQRIKVWKVQEWEYSKLGTYIPGQVVAADQHQGLVVACGEGFLRLIKIQVEGKKVMEDVEFLRGNPIKVGAVFRSEPISEVSQLWEEKEQ